MPQSNDAVRTLQANEDGLIIVSLLADFLEHTSLFNALEVFTHEADLNQLPLFSRDDLCSILGLVPNTSSPVLSSLLSAYRSVKRRSEDNSSSEKRVLSDGQNQISYADPPSPHQPHNERAGNTTPVNHSRSGSAASTTVRSLANGGAGNGALANSHVNGITSSSSSPATSVSEHPPPSEHSGSSPSNTVPPNSAHLNHGRPDGSPSHCTLTPREPEYMDDFDSPRSLGSRRTLSADSHRGGAEQQPQHSSNETLLHSTDSGHHPIEGVVRTITPNSIVASERSNRGGRSSTSPVIRVYAKSSRRPPSDVSDVDEADDDEDIPEVLKDYSVSEDSAPDQTIDSDESLGLDHVEDVRIRPNPAAATTGPTG
ncbi:hypothetical protein CRM22_000899 [Opisthorchis felineus]|uniref:LisH domain-containing protein n=1 Tax=Opisthorchis felineus TaxID=147828 RepID=A0A4S2MD05_OPIFE|nr:hypothetical protein CRM22_000899 [Opisthorchis felineus]